MFTTRKLGLRQMMKMDGAAAYISGAEPYKNSSKEVKKVVGLTMMTSA